MCLYASRKLDVSYAFTIFLYSWHALFCYFYALFVLAYGGDAPYYYQQSQLNTVDFSIGTTAVIYLARPFTYYLDLSFLATSFVFNIAGALGLMFFYAALRFVTEGKWVFYRRLVLLVVLLPSCSFWSSALGKDAISFLSVTIAVWSMRDGKLRFFALIISVLLMIVVRIHIAFIMVLALALAGALQKRKIGFGSVAALLCSLIGLTLLLPLALSYTGLELDSFQNVSDYVGKRQDYNQDGGGAIDISQMILPLQMFTYLFRPSLIEAKSAFQLITAVENTFLTFFMFLATRFYLQKRKLFSRQWFYTLYTFGAWVILASTTANLGIAARQKWMIVPFVVMMVLSAAPNFLQKNLGVLNRKFGKNSATFR